MHKIICIFTMILVTGCASKFAPVVSRPDNLIIECETGCKFNIPMNTEIVVARNTNGYDVAKSLVGQIPFIGAIALSWRSMNTAENIAEAAIGSFNRGSAAAPQAQPNIDNSQHIDNSQQNVTTSTDSSGSGNSADVATTDSSGSGNTTGPADSGNTTITGGPGDLNTGPGYISKPSTVNTTTYSNAFNDAGSCNGTGCTPAAPITP